LATASHTTLLSWAPGGRKTKMWLTSEQPPKSKMYSLRWTWATSVICSKCWSSSVAFVDVCYSTGLPLWKARWLPRCGFTPRAVLPPQARPQTPRPERPPSSDLTLEHEAVPLTPAWDPLSWAHETFVSRTSQRGKISTMLFNTLPSSQF
jgi:hypothetical protein